MEKIGLFPLKLVLFPESVLPLHIFEERYKKLIRDCREGEEIFGVVLSQPEIRDVGCTAKVTKIIREYDDGRLDILVEGEKRFHLKDYNKGPESYYIGEVDYFYDVEKGYDYDLLRECIGSYNRIVDSMDELLVDKLTVADIATETPSFMLAQKSGLDLDKRQDLLTMNSENRRLALIKFHLQQILPMLKKYERMTMLVKNDGYLEPGKMF